MKTKILMLALSLAAMSSSTMAEWVKIGSYDSFDNYAEPSTIRTNGNRVKMWTLRNYNSVQTDGMVSMTAQKEYDCAEEQVNVLFLTGYTGPMGHGNEIASGTTRPDWRPISPGRLSEIEWKLACGKLR